MGAGEDILARIAAAEKRLSDRANETDKKIERLLAHLGANRPAQQSGGESRGQTAPGSIATVAQITGAKGDIKIRMNPRDWKGEPCKGLLSSQCPPDFLEVYADQMDYFASVNEDPKKAEWDRLDGARCRRWAIEIREGRSPAKRADASPPTSRSNRGNGGDAWADNSSAGATQQDDAGW